MPDDLLSPSDDVLPDEDPSAEALRPLLVDVGELRAEYRSRKRTFFEKTVPAADVPGYEENGWEVLRANKTTVRMRQQKSHDRKLEDRVWCLLYKMNYPAIGGEKFNIHFRRSDGSKGKKQIDAFALDGETAFVIECKSRETRGRKSLQKDIHETKGLQDYIRKSIFKHARGGPKPKIIWAYVTSNVVWSEPDIARANDADIRIFTESELQYYETFIGHMGPAGRYQLLGDFLDGQKVPGLDNVKLPAIKGKIGGETFYSFVANPEALLKISFVNHQALDRIDGQPAYQRMISSSRIKDIGKFIESGGFFPSNVIINFVQHPRFDPISNADNSDPNIKFGWLTLPRMYKSAWVIDGQHRLYGYSRLSSEHLKQSLFVLAFGEMEKEKEADIFITINNKQKSVPRGLLDSLLADLRLGSSDPKVAIRAQASAIVRVLNADPSSPLHRRFSQPGVPPEPTQNLTLSEVVKGFARSGLLGRVVHNTVAHGPLTDADEKRTVQRARKILNGYFEIIRDASSARWEVGKPAYVSVNAGIRAHLMLLAEIINYLERDGYGDFVVLKERDVLDRVRPFLEPVTGFLRDETDEKMRELFKVTFGEGGPRAYFYALCGLVRTRYKDFGPPDYVEFVRQNDTARVDKADQLIIRLTKDITDTVVFLLKRIHGENAMPSGEAAYWDIGIESKSAKKKAFEKQQEDPAESRLKKEAYLDIMDLKEIIQQKNNWDHFKEYFSIPMQGENRGKKYFTAWIARFNELRRIPAHKSSMRTYKDEDLEFLEWLRVEFYGRLEDLNHDGN